MSTSLRAESFADINIVEVTVLTADSVVGATTLTVKSTVGFTTSQAIYVGTTGQDGCELAYVATVASGTSLTLSAALLLPHSKYDPVTGVVGDKLRVYRASNVDGTAPIDGNFTVLGTRQIDPDQQSTYFTDSTGSSDYWYKLTYFNSTTLDETALSASTAVRGDDFGHYASITEIRSKAGFENAFNLKDRRIDMERRAAESEINTTLAGHYTVPFQKPVPEFVNTLTIQLAAGLLLLDVYGSGHVQGKDMVKSAREQLQTLRTNTGALIDTAEGADSSSSISSWPDETTTDERAFTGVDQDF